MTINKENKGINVGIDVGKFQLDIYLLEKQRHFTVNNDEYGIKEAIRIIRRYKVMCIALEATGRYEFEFVSAAFEKSLPVSVVKPLQIRQFAKASEQLAKTDKIDAKIISQFAAMMKPRLSVEVSKNQRLIKDLVIRRRQLIDMRTMELNREKVMGKAVKRSCNRSIKALNRDISWTEKQLAKAVELEPAWSDRRELLSTVPGVGDTLIFTLLSEMPELGTLNNKQIAKLTGPAPINHDSGKLKGKRRIQGGRALIRTTLFMATMSAIQCNPLIGGFSQHLVRQGKHKKVALTAAMRKFLTIVNALVRDNAAWAY